MKLKIKKFYWIFGILLLLGCTYFTPLTNLSQLNYTSNDRPDPKLSAFDINIATPENNTYTAPMSGYYPATYGFENDNPGDPPDEWVLNSMDGSSFVEVDSNLDGHNNVVEIRKNGGSSSAGMRNDFSMNVTVETIEFWLYKDTDSGTDATFFSIVSIDGFLGNAQGVILDGDFYYMPSNFASRILVASDIINISTWHHFKMEFNVSKGWQITIDDILYGENYTLPFRGSVTGNPMESFFVQSLFSGGLSNYGVWVDAVGYSWDPGYSVGDNSKEGLLLSFSTQETLVWIGYSLDGYDNVTILGNITFPIPSDGQHTIQVFGNDSLSTFFESDIQYFTVSISNETIFKFQSASKVINKGQQIGTWNPYNIMYNDTFYDGTKFALGSSGTIVKQDPTYFNFGVYNYGTYPPKVYGPLPAATLKNAIATDNGHWLFAEGVMVAPATGSFEWGGYSDIAPEQHQHVSGIRIDYAVMCQAGLWPNILDQANDLRIWAYDDVGNSDYKTISAGPPGDGYWHRGTFTIDSQTILDRVKAGGHITKMALSMYCWEPLFSYVWMNIDYIKLNYDYNTYDLDFIYELDFGGYNIGNVSEFSIDLDINQSLPGIYINIWNFGTDNWETLGTLNHERLWNKTINVDADLYFSTLDKIKLQFVMYGYYDDQSPSNYTLSINLVKIFIPPPDKPDNVNVDQGILHIYLTWDVPHSYGLPITKYNIYRGEIMGGMKELNGTSVTNEYNDTSITAGTIYYYVISAETATGESDNSTEVSGKGYDQPFVIWTSPEESEPVIFPYNVSDDFDEWVIFNFEYDWAELDDVILEINGSSYGSVWNSTTARIYPYIDGFVEATLKGYNNTILIDSDTRYFTFVRIDFEVREILNDTTEHLGKQLYLILHDPNGDNSHSGFTETTILSMGVGVEQTFSIGLSVEIGYYKDLDDAGEIGGSVKLEGKSTLEDGYDFRYEITDMTGLTSSLEDSNPDYIGPLYGDIYWGETWLVKWVLNATYREYSNGTMRWEKPQLFYDILRDVESLIGDDNAPPEWKAQNYYHNNTIDVMWLRMLELGGNPEYTDKHEVKATQTRRITHTFEFGMDFQGKFPVVLETHLTLDFKTKNYVEVGQTSIYETMFYINDDEPTDLIVQGVGIDKRFGTFIFNTSSFFCETSYPLEHNTYDYLPPIIGYPLIQLDSNNDGYAPSSDDTPIITVDVFEEGGVQEAILRYSVDNGTTWEIIHLSELPGSPGTWESTLPAQPVNTKVLWYIQIWDNAGHNSTRYNNYGNPFDYTVIKKPKAPPGIPGFPIAETMAISIILVAALIMIYHRKRFR